MDKVLRVRGQGGRRDLGTAVRIIDRLSALYEGEGGGRHTCEGDGNDSYGLPFPPPCPVFLFPSKMAPQCFNLQRQYHMTSR